MRAKVLLPVVGVAALILGPTIYFHFAPNASPTTAATTVATEAAPAVTNAPPAATHEVLWKKVHATEAAAPSDESSDPALDHENFVMQRKAELTQMGMSDDPADLKTVLSELNNKDPEIRGAALSATVQFGSKDAIPALQNEMQWAEDPQEKVDILNAIKYLQLPTFQEFQATIAQGASQARPGDQDQQPAPAN